MDELLRELAGRAPDVRADFVGHLVFDLMDDLDPASLSADMRHDLEHFIDRVGFEEGDTEEQTRARIEAHFAKNPIDAELLRLFAALSRALAQDETEDEEIRGRIASRLYGSDGAARPVGGEAPTGTISAGPMGLAALLRGKAPVGEATPPPVKDKKTSSR